jgi:hypothetical protein
MPSLLQDLGDVEMRRHLAERNASTAVISMRDGHRRRDRGVSGDE